MESIFHATSVLFEIPSGLLADRFSYKSNLYLSRLASILSCILMLAGQGNFWIYALAMIPNALAYNFDSGTATAMLYDSAVEGGLKEHFLKISSFISGVAEATISLGTVLAGFFVHGYLHVTYYIMIGLSLLVMLLISFLKEPQRQHQKAEVLTMGKIIGTVRLEFKNRPSLFVWMIIFQIVGVLMCMFYFYYQKELPELASWQISAVMLAGSGFNILAVALASRIGKSWPSLKLFPLMAAATGAVFILSMLGTPLVYILVYLLSNTLYALYQPVFSNDLQEYLPSPVRATMLSVNSMLFSLSMIVIFPITGWLIDSLGFRMTFISLGVFLLLLTPFLQQALKRVARGLRHSPEKIS
ncbi:hypothetical protein STRDD11_02519 [Streptococcus sp. DD11]|nr:hypothetical protein STRDD11_02519 [Streptococcus sp. DD11]